MDPVKLNSSALSLELRYLKWDSIVAEHHVLEINKIEIQDIQRAQIELKNVIQDLSSKDTALISCRIPHQFLTESMLLEAAGFKFIEVVLHPFMDRLSEKKFVVDETILIREAKETELENLSKIAQVCFTSDRFSVDHRIPDKFSGIRYKNWLLSCKNSSKQKVYLLSENMNTVGFFIVEEDLDSRNTYWHLTAISTSHQGKGLGRRCWEAMLLHYKLLNFNEVSTSISARNTPVLNLYSKLDFRFRNPEMTFHWVNNDLLKKNDH